MADAIHLHILCSSRLSGTDLWDKWRSDHSEVTPDLRDADLTHLDLRFRNLAGVRLVGANLSGVDLTGSTLDGANLSNAILRGCSFGDEALDRVGTSCKSVNFHGADLTDATFCRASCEGADFTGAILRNVDIKWSRLHGCRFIGGDWDNSTIVQCHVYGVSVWGMNGTPARHANFNVASDDWPRIQVDDLETAQLVHLLVNSHKARSLFETIGSKGVLILGRFSEERKRLLDAIREELRKLGFLPFVFDFQRPTQRDFTETVKTLAGLSRFIIADITQPKSIPLELQATIPDYMVPFVPILHEGDQPFSMFVDLQRKYGDWVLDVLTYDSESDLMSVLESAVVQPALERANKLLIRKSEGLRVRHVRDYHNRE